MQLDKNKIRTSMWKGLGAGIILTLAFWGISFIPGLQTFHDLKGLLALFSVEAAVLGFVKTAWWNVFSKNPDEQMKANVETFIASLSFVSAVVSILSPFISLICPFWFI